MSYYLLHSDGQALLASDRPIVKAKERPALDDAFTLLDRLREEAARRSEVAATVEHEARERGYREGHAAGQAAFARAIADLAVQAEAHRQTEEAEIASLALAAVRQIAGQVGDAAMMQGVALRAVQAVAPQGSVIVDVPPSIAAQVEAGLASAEEGHSITVRIDPSLGERQCRVSGPNSRIIADLDRQIDELSERWKIDHVD
jgi:flagellar biosynthesis/type III secretory pathway protein FliH